MSSLAMLGGVVGRDAAQSSDPGPPPEKAPLVPGAARPTIGHPHPPGAQDGAARANDTAGEPTHMRMSSESEWTDVDAESAAASVNHSTPPTTDADGDLSAPPPPLKDPAPPPAPHPTSADASLAPTHYNRVEPFPAPAKAHAERTAPPDPDVSDPLAVADPALNTATAPTGSAWNRSSTTAGAAQLAPRISTPPVAELRSDPNSGAGQRAAVRLTPPAPPPKDALAPLVAGEFKDDMGKVRPAPGERDDRPAAYIPPAESRAQMPDHLDGLAHTEGVTITQVSEKTAHDPGIRDVGWNERPEEIPRPVIGGVQNEMLWMMVRRFNKQMYHVKAVPEEKIVGPLDLQVAEEEEFSPDKLRANLERLYVSVIIGLMAFVKHTMRLRSWNEPKRTAVWLAVYIVAWATDMILPAIFTLVLVLILFPPARPALFPPAPLALVSSKTGNLQTPRAGTLATGDTLTGAPENHAGEAAEQEATNFVNGFASLAVGTALGKHPDGDADTAQPAAEQPMDKTLPDPSNLGTTALDAKSTAGGQGMEGQKDKTKQPMEVAIWTKARPAMRGLTAVADTWEMMGNALSPTPPFNHRARYKLAGVVLPLIVATALTSSEVLIKVVGAGAGFGFFGQPAIDCGLAYLNTHYPGWQRALDLRNSLLLGVPTHAQLTLALLRIGEANKAPLPPPPMTDEAPASRPSSPVMKHEDLPVDLQNSEVEKNVPPEEAPGVAHGSADSKPQKKQHKLMSKVGALLKGTTKAGVGGVIGADHVKASLGSEHAKQRLGIIPPSGDTELVDGPSVFEARVSGKKGHVIISTTATTPCVSWIPAGNKKSKQTGEWDAEFSLLLRDIAELKKLGGLGWKGKLVVGWAYEREVYDGLEVTDVRGGKWTFTAMKRRDELFNRLVALVSHKWEAW